MEGSDPEEARPTMLQLVGIVVGVILLCASGVALEKGGGAVRMVGHVLVTAGGAVTGFLLALILAFRLWPGACVAVLCPMCYQAPPPEELWRAGVIYFVVLGVLGGLLPSAPFQLGYGVAVLGVMGTGSHWAGEGGDGVLLLLGAIAWVVVDLVVWGLRRWVRGGADDGPGAASPARAGDFWDGKRWLASRPT
jgi:hypothetical protein